MVLGHLRHLELLQRIHATSVAHSILLPQSYSRWNVRCHFSGAPVLRLERPSESKRHSKRMFLPTYCHLATESRCPGGFSASRKEIRPAPRAVSLAQLRKLHRCFDLAVRRPPLEGCS